MMKRNLIKAILGLAILGTLGACKPVEKQQTAVESAAYMAMAEKMIGSDATFAFNENRSYVLAQTDLSKNMEQRSFKYFVFDMKAEKVVLEQQVESGYVKWLSPIEVEVFRTPGKMRSGQTRDDYTDVYNVKTGNSTPKTEWKSSN